eukprot:g16768.t1
MSDEPWHRVWAECLQQHMGKQHQTSLSSEPLCSAWAESPGPARVASPCAARGLRATDQHKQQVLTQCVGHESQGSSGKQPHSSVQAA